jgi:hypothetical protein
MTCACTELFFFFILSEIWLINDINSNELGMSSFTVFLNDPNHLNSVHVKGGGRRSHN